MFYLLCVDLKCRVPFVEIVHLILKSVTGGNRLHNAFIFSVE